MAGYDFKLYDSDNVQLNYVIYVIQCFGCLFSLGPFLFILHCWVKRADLRSRRTMFTVYLSALDMAGRLIFFVYYVIRLLTLDKKFTIDDSQCHYLSSFLYNASAWPLSSVILLQLHTLAASAFSNKYETYITRRTCIISMLLTFFVDLCIAVAAQLQLQQFMQDHNWDYLIDDCKFEYFSRYSLMHSWKIFIQLLIIGFCFLCQVSVSFINWGHRKSDFSNPVANSPFHRWASMSRCEKWITVVLQVCGAVSFTMFIVSYVIFLLEGNSDSERLLTLGVTFFVFVGPLEMIWFNVDLRDAFFRSTKKSWEAIESHQHQNKPTKDEPALITEEQ